MENNGKEIKPEMKKAGTENWLKKLGRKLKTDRKAQIVLIVVVAVLAAGIVLGYYAMSEDGFSFSDLGDRAAKTEEETVTARRLDGVIVDEGETDHWPVAVMIENITSVRPQSGLSEANVVYEALAEGGITRFMAIFDNGGDNIKKIGPVRSARSYYLEWLSEYDALYTFSGAYNVVLGAVDGLDIKNINAMYNGQYYWRDSGAAAPHNLFTSSEKLKFALRDQGLDKKEVNYRSWKFEDEAVEADRPTEAQEVKIDFSSAGYRTVYKYDRAANTYQRYNPEGAAHTDRNSDVQIAPKNLIVIRVSNKTIDDHGRLEMDVHGEGEAIMFANGEATKGTWKKKDRTSRTVFYNEDGSEYSLVRGQTWVAVVPPDQSVTY